MLCCVKQRISERSSRQIPLFDEFEYNGGQSTIPSGLKSAQRRNKVSSLFCFGIHLAQQKIAAAFRVKFHCQTHQLLSLYTTDFAKFQKHTKPLCIQGRSEFIIALKTLAQEPNRPECRQSVLRNVFPVFRLKALFQKKSFCNFGHLPLYFC